ERCRGRRVPLLRLCQAPSAPYSSAEYSENWCGGKRGWRSGTIQRSTTVLLSVLQGGTFMVATKKSSSVRIAAGRVIDCWTRITLKHRLDLVLFAQKEIDESRRQ